MIMLERKEKFGEYISKKSLKISKEQYYSLIGGGDINFLLESDSQMAKDMFCAIKAKFLHPAVIVDYEREPFVLREGNVRITFDKNIQAGVNTPDMFSGNLTSVSVLDPGIMVLEVKFDDYLPTHVRRLLQISSHNLCAVSKYVMCRLKQFEVNPASQFMLSPAVYDNLGR